jgi:rubredoxin
MEIIKAPVFEISTCRRCGTVFKAEPGDTLFYHFKRGVVSDPIEAIDTECPVCQSFVRIYTTYKEESDEL